jgi:hypothetical protein
MDTIGDGSFLFLFIYLFIYILFYLFRVAQAGLELVIILPQPPEHWLPPPLLLLQPGIGIISGILFHIQPKGKRFC